MSQQLEFNGHLARAARAIAGVNPMYVAQEAGLSRQQLRDFEKGVGELSEAESRQLKITLEHLGARFITEDAHGGQGVRAKFPRSKVTQVENWEGEGGPVGEDDA
ncbi:XRE family transcriptional regulator [Auritidibacter ignavus]|uniref:XRE family transcriptional regulator n=1 Tax=Auritidibacter ignavus TaxID=678932 RepID=UPI002449825F|nr:XRE family transcriptional regulator [Auritidibacter ignavus]WGH89840.1 XRE family transcriptional regulator [Auritidibacter ignavus]WHS27209.1 XRE family transcriptional regulator [Auritidibacter ignavus]